MCDTPDKRLPVLAQADICRVTGSEQHTLVSHIKIPAALPLFPADCIGSRSAVRILLTEM